MADFIPGDKVVSDKYGAGRITAYSKVIDEAVLVTFGPDQIDNAYDPHTGHRLPRFGSDVITHQEVLTID